MSANNIIALIPAWNEGARIAAVLDEVQAYLPVVVVDDGSQDKTAVIAETTGATVIRHDLNQGKGAALSTGFEWARRHGYRAVITLDADGQHDPADIPRFLAAFAQGGGGLIIGRRDFSQMPFPRNVVNPIGSWLLSRALQTQIHDNQSGYRLYESQFLGELDLTSPGFEMEVEIIIKAVCLDLPIGWVNIRTVYKSDKVSYFDPVKDTARFLRTVWRAYLARRAAESQG
jgi:glycosyltransferase involved in cell wall biosynthesis